MKHYKIICIAQVFNELEKGNLRRFIKYVKPLCDGLIIYDDGSTDGSYEYIRKVTPYVIRGKKNDFESEIFHKALLLEKAKEFGADFVFYLDADEVMSAGAKDMLQKLAQKCIDKKIDALQFHKINLWRSDTWQRTDSLFDIGWFPHFWRITPQTKYTHIKKGLHQNPYPSTVKNIVRSNAISILHYGFANEKNLAYKYLTYKAYGQRGYDMLDRLINEEQLQLRKVPKELFPNGLYRAGELPPQRKYFSESLAYVEKFKQDFLKYQPRQTKPKNARNNPLVTIITPTFNRAKLLEKTIVSILSQDYLPIEYIIVDDGSTDSTEAVVRKFQKIKTPGKKIIYVKQKNAGETQAVNRGFSLARGEYVAVVSSDDPLLSECTSDIVEYLEQHPKVLAVYPDWEMINENGKQLKTVHPMDYNFLTMLGEHYCMPGPGTFFRKKAIQLTGGRDKRFRYLADYAFWLKLSMYGPLYHLRKTLASFRVHSGSQGVYAKSQQMANESIDLLDVMYADVHMPAEGFSVKKAAYASGYYHGAKNSHDFLLAMRYYFLSLLTNPFIFLKKLAYDVKTI